MSRFRNATITAVFSYGQFAIAIASGIVLVPLTLHRVGAIAYGLWLTSGEVLGHAGMVELGVINVLPWMLAEADGRGDREEMRRLVGEGVLVAALIGLAYVALAALGWWFLPGVLRLSAAERSMVVGPLILLVLANGASYPLRVFQGVLAGIQDVYFNGVFTLVNTLAGVSVTAVLLVKGFGLYALAAGAALPSLIILFTAVARVMVVAPDLLRGWQLPALSELKALVQNGAGAWLSDIGWALVASTNGIVITYIGHPEWVAIYACTSKLSAMSVQMAWIIPDSGLVGLAQLYGTRPTAERLRGLAMMLLRLHLLIAGAAVCGYLAFNPAFVTRWVGGSNFGGVPLNMLLGAGVLASSFIHGIISTASVLGRRFETGIVTLVNGLAQGVLGVMLGHRLGLPGVAAAALIAGFLVSVPAGFALLRSSTALTAAHVAADLAGPWFLRAAPVIAVAAAVGWFHASLGLVASAALAEVVMLAYAWQMRPFYVGLPLDPALYGWLVRLRLVDPVAAAAVVGSGAAIEPPEELAV